LFSEVWQLQQGVVVVPQALDDALRELNSGDGGEEKALLMGDLNHSFD
jgi:hypothetical protein